MIRLMGLVDFGKSFKNEAELTDKQKQLDVDKDGEIEASDLAKLRAGEEPKTEGHGGDHEVSMAHSTLDNLIKNAMELKTKMGEGEKNIPAWIQDHIAVAGNNIEQANTNYHEYQAELVPRTESPTPEAQPVAEKAPEGWEGTVKAMKDEPSIDNPYALANWMKSKGYKSHKGK